MPAGRFVQIAIDTTLNEVRITDLMIPEGDVHLDYHGKIGQPITIERASMLSYFDADCLVKFTTPMGETGFFKHGEISEVSIDGILVSTTDLQDLINQLGQYFFAPLAGGGGASNIIGLHFQHNRAHKQFIRWPLDSTITGVTTTNLNAYKIWVNDVQITPLVFPISMVQGDRVYAEIDHTGSGNAQIDLQVSGIAVPIIYNSLTYYHPRTMIHKENVKPNTLWMHQTDQAIEGQGNTASFQTNCVFGDSIENAFSMIYEPALWNFTGQHTFGLNDLSLPYNTVNRYPRMRYCIMLDANAVKIYEFGILKATIALPYNQMFHYRFFSKFSNPPGAYSMAYQYSTDNMATWNALYNSLDFRAAGVDLYPDWATQGGYHAKHHPPMIIG
jgi:hypothetical protein